VVEYALTVQNNGSQPASGMRVTDVLNGNLTLLTGAYGSGDVAVQVGVGPASTVFCTADAGDGDSDGCGLAGSTLQVSPPGLVVGTTAATNPIRVLFRATIH